MSAFPGLRVVVVGPLPPPSGGMANQTRQLVDLLRAEGLDVRLVQTNPPYRPGWIAGMRGLRAVFRLVPYIVELWRSAGRADLLHVMANSGWSWHLFAAPAVWIAWLRGVPSIVNYRGGEAATFLGKSAAWVRPTMRKARALAVPSGFLRDVFGRFGIESVIVPNVIDTELFAPGLSSSAARAGPPPDAPHLLVARNLEPIYDLPTAIEAFARVRERFPAARLTIAGSGPERERLEALVRERGLASAIRFTGRLEHAAMAELYRSADLVLNPARADNMPNSVLEAMACGVPVVSTDVGGVPYLVRAGVTALLVLAGDPGAMAAAAVRILETPELAASLRSAGTTAVQQYTWARVRNRLFEVYAHVGRRGHACTEVSP